jgi:hypothetical protein
LKSDSAMFLVNLFKINEKLFEKSLTCIYLTLTYLGTSNLLISYDKFFENLENQIISINTVIIFALVTLFTMLLFPVRIILEKANL